MAPIENARGSGWRGLLSIEERLLRKLVSSSDQLLREEFNPYSSNSFPFMETSGIFVVKSDSASWSTRFSDLVKMGPKSVADLETSPVLSRLGCKVSFQNRPPVLNFFVRNGSERVEYQVWHGLITSKRKLEEEIIRDKVVRAIVALSILPINLLREVGSHGLVITEEKRYQDGSPKTAFLFPGKFLGKSHNPQALYPSDVFEQKSLEIERLLKIAQSYHPVVILFN